MSKKQGRPRKGFFSKVASQATKSAFKKAQKRKSVTKSIPGNNLNSISKQIYVNEVTGQSIIVYNGFSFPALFFSPIWCLLKGLYLHAVLSFVFALTGIGFIYWIVLGVKGNEWYKEDLIKKGYQRL